MDTVAPLLDTLNRLWCVIGGKYERNVEEIKIKAWELFARRDDVNERINIERLNIPTTECIYWLKEVKETEDEVKNVLEKIEENDKCLYGWCPNVYRRMKQVERVEDILKKVTVLTNWLSSFEGRELLAVGPNTSSHRTFSEIFECIREVGIQSIGIYGEFGVGKTRMMKLLIDHREIDEIFDIVIWVTVSKNWNKREMQDEIARHLRLNMMNAASDDQIRVEIYEALMTKKFLLLLDDVWERIDLADVGIPTLNEENGCRVILTTRNLRVCSRMEIDVVIQIEVLSYNESWRLFQETVGRRVMSPNGDVVAECRGLPIAICIVGSILAGDTDENLGGRFVIQWRDAVRQLGSPATSEIEDMEEAVFRPLRFIYDQLQRNSEKMIFLYCALFPEDYEIKISQLVNYCWVEGFIDGADDIAKAQNIGHSIVNHLLDVSLLQRGKNEGYVKMYCVVRHLALRITSTTGGGPRFLVRAGTGLQDPPEEDEWKQLERISLMMNELCSLPEMPNSSSLSTLMLQGNESLTAIPDSFFKNMASLRVLDISGAVIESLPSSTQNLVSLGGLWLRHCVYLTSLPSQLGALKGLLVLDLSGTEMKCVPGEIGELTHLRRLIISFMKIKILEDNEEGEKERQKIIKERFPVGMISRMPLLEELGMHMQDSDDWQQWDDASMDAVADELCTLRCLTYLDFYFSTESCFEQFVQKNLSSREGQLNRFRLRVGSCKTERVFSDFEYANEVKEGCLIYRGGGGSGVEHKEAMGKVLCHCSRFMLNGHHLLRKLSELGLRNMGGLEQCYVINCDKMENLFEDDEDGEIVPIDEDAPILQNLQKLVLFHLPQLVSIFQGISLDRVSLKHVELNECGNMKAAFSGDIIHTLSNLEELCVCNCPSMQEIIVGNEDKMLVLHGHFETPVLPKLKKLVLTELPEMVDICRGVSLDWTALTHVELNGCTKLTWAFSGNIIYRLSNLEELSVCNCPSMQEILVVNEDEMPVSQAPVLPKLKTLVLTELPEMVDICRGVSLDWTALTHVELNGCTKLRWAFSGNIIYRLSNLEELSVCNCPSMQEILVVNEDEMPVSQAPILPKLKTLVLTELPEMVDICRGVSLDWTALTHLELNGCTKLTSAFSGDILYRLSNLEMLSISSCPSMEELIGFGQVHHQFRIAPDTVSLPGFMYIEVYESPELPNLKNLRLRDLPELLQFYPGAPLAWPSLKEIDIKHCQKLKSLSLDGSSAPNLDRIQGETKWWQELEWKDNDIKQRFQPLFHPISE